MSRSGAAPSPADDCFRNEVNVSETIEEERKSIPTRAEMHSSTAEGSDVATPPVAEVSWTTKLKEADSRAKSSRVEPGSAVPVAGTNDAITSKQLIQDYCLDSEHGTGSNDPPAELRYSIAAFPEAMPPPPPSKPGAVRMSPKNPDGRGEDPSEWDASRSLYLEIAPTTPPPNTQGLAVARPVAAGMDSARNLPIGNANEIDPAEETVRKRMRKRTTRRYLMALALGGCAIILGTLLGVLLTGNSNASKPPEVVASLPPTPNSSSSIFTEEIYLRSLLPNHTVQILDADPASPQATALDWLLGHANLTEFPPWRLRQRFAMATFYFATQGRHWRHGFATTWIRADLHECHWESQKSLIPPLDWHDIYDLVHSVLFQTSVDHPCEWDREDGTLELWDDAGTLQHLWLWEASLVGTIPPEIGMLTRLRSVNLDSDLFGEYTNYLHGSLPTEIGLCTDLEVLTIQRNNVTRHLPTEVGVLSRLSFLRIVSDHLCGEIPSELGALAAMNTLAIAGNIRFGDPVADSCVGVIPSELGLLTATKNMDLSWNYLSGRIPSDLAFMTALTSLSLTGNDMTGPVPSDVGSMTALWSLDLSQNAFTSMPSEFVLLTALRLLNLGSNGMTGSIPTQIGFLTSMEDLSLRENQFWGPVPSELGLLKDLITLELDSNQLSGYIPSEFANLNASYLNLENNELLGSIPANLCAMQYAMILFTCSADMCGCDLCPCSGG